MSEQQPLKRTPVTKLSMTRSLKDGDDLVIEHRLTVEDELYFEKRAFRVRFDRSRGEDIYTLRVIRRINDDELIVDFSNDLSENDLKQNKVKIRAMTYLPGMGRSHFFERWTRNWTPILPMSPVVPQQIDHVVNVEPFTIVRMDTLSETSNAYIYPTGSVDGLHKKHVWEFVIEKKMPCKLDQMDHFEELRSEPGSHYVTAEEISAGNPDDNPHNSYNTPHKSHVSHSKSRNPELDLNGFKHEEMAQSVDFQDLHGMGPPFEDSAQNDVNVGMEKEPDVDVVEEHAPPSVASRIKKLESLSGSSRFGGSSSSNRKVKQIICDEIIPPMSKGLNALEKLLCSDHTRATGSSHHNVHKIPDYVPEEVSGVMGGETATGVMEETGTGVMDQHRNGETTGQTGSGLMYGISNLLSGVMPGDPDISGGVSGDPNISGRVSGDPNISGRVSGNPNISGGVSGNPDISEGVSGNPDISGGVSGDPQVTEVVTGEPEPEEGESESKADASAQGRTLELSQDKIEERLEDVINEDTPMNNLICRIKIYGTCEISAKCKDFCKH